jgi:hypothetical protein
MKKKYIIGLGCSWTQGEGGYPDEIWKQYNGSPQRALRCKDDYAVRKYELENSWVNVLCRDHFTDYTPVNLGVKGIGNRAAVHQLHFCDVVDWENSEGIIVLMLSGFERFDFFREHPKCGNAHSGPDMYSNDEFVHNKWRTMWPVETDHGDAALWRCYARDLWSDQFVASEQMMALLDLQTFAKAHGYKLVIANGFNQHDKLQSSMDYLKEHTGSLANKLDWDNYLHTTTPYTAFMQKLVELDGLLPVRDWGNYYNFYKVRDWPAKYLTNCDGAHPTIDGYKIIGEELAKFIRLRGYV